MSKKANKLTLMAILTAVALIIFIIEAQFPLPIPVPGVKLGLANIITLFALFYQRNKQGMQEGHSKQKNQSKHEDQCKHEKQNKQSKKDSRNEFFTTSNVFSILFCRIVLGTLLTGRLIVLVYSLTGGVFGFIAQIMIKRFVSNKQIWVCGAVGGIFHNIGQILAAAVITGTPAIIAYLPILIIAGILTGILTGFIAQFAVARIPESIA